MAAPHFGAMGGTSVVSGYQKLNKLAKNVLVKIFQPVVEVFIWTLLVQDVIALWVPRMYNALTRGSFEYNPKTDPANQGKTPWEIFKHTFKERAKRLNWINFAEETWREIASGPAIFLWPTLIFSVGRRMADGTGIELQYGPLTKLTDTFAKHHTQQSFGHTEADHKSSLRSFVENLFADHEMKNALMKENGKTTGKTYGSALTEWIHDWTEEIYRGKGLSFGQMKEKIEHHQQMEALEKRLADLVEEYNRNYKPESQFYKYQETKIKWLERVGKTKALNEKVEEVAASKIFAHITRWKDFAFHALKEQAEHKYSPEGFVKMLDQLRRKLMFKKLSAALLSTAATLLFLFNLVYWTQVHNAYPANRRLTKKNAQKANAPASEAVAPQQAPLHQIPAFPGAPANAFSLQSPAMPPQYQQPFVFQPAAGGYNG